MLATALTLTYQLGAIGEVPPGFEIVRITDDGNEDRYVQLNDCGQVVFNKFISMEEGHHIFCYENGQTTRLTWGFSVNVMPDINDGGVMVWSRKNTLEEPVQIMILEDGEVRQLDVSAVDDFSPQINEQGHVAWGRFFGDGCRDSRCEIMFYDGNEVSHLTDDAFSNQMVGLNDLDVLTWTRYDFCLDPWESDVMLLRGDELLQLTDQQLEPRCSSINNWNQVVWGGPDGIELWETGVTTQITDWGRNPHINDRSDILFLRWHDDLENWHVWYYSDGEFCQLSADDEYLNVDGDINNYGEVVWEMGPWEHRDIRMMRRFRTGDMDFDGRIDSHDYKWWAGCATGPVETDRLCECRFLDIDQDRDVDLADFAIFQHNCVKGTQAASTGNHP